MMYSIFNVSSNPLRILGGAGAILLLLSSEVLAENVTAGQMTISGSVRQRTCTFDNDTQTIPLQEVAAVRFKNNSTALAETEVTVPISCDDGINTVSIVPSGEASPDSGTDYKNTGTAQNVGLRFMSQERIPLPPDGSEKVSVNPVNGSGSYTFLAGYSAVSTEAVKGGTFAASVTLSFEYQ